ncbi:MAG TPA: ROK family transcriptional regulator [Pyrinomonadaceae bacterium]|nr:ROK family transcriptional regulator [Pyrinomonadaceae bacterium]
MKKIYLHKAKNQIARPNTIRGINKQIVLNYVRDRAPISRAEISRETALQRSTVSAIVDDLQDAGLIEEIGTGDSTGGRKPTLLKIRTGVPVAVGIDVTPRRTTIATADLSGQILEKETFPTSPDAARMSEKIIAKVTKYAELHNEYDLEVGISVPGIADQANGNVVYIPYFQWSNWDIARQITEKTGLPVVVDNDANAVALAELWFGEERIRKHRNFITVLVAEGIGTGIIFDGQVYRGEKGAAGEFGHMIVGDNAPVECSCGSRVCWEAHASEKASVYRYQISSGSTENGGVNFEQLIKLAREGKPHATKALKESGKYLGIGISNLIVGFSPQAVVISGNIVKAWALIKDEIQSLAERSVRQGLDRPTITASSLGGSPTLTGSLSLVLARKFASAS